MLPCDDEVLGEEFETKLPKGSVLGGGPPELNPAKGSLLLLLLLEANGSEEKEPNGSVELMR